MGQDVHWTSCPSIQWPLCPNIVCFTEKGTLNNFNCIQYFCLCFRWYAHMQGRQIGQSTAITHCKQHWMLLQTSWVWSVHRCCLAYQDQYFAFDFGTFFIKIWHLVATILINFPFLINQHILWFIPVQCSAHLPMWQCRPKVSVWQLDS